MAERKEVLTNMLDELVLANERTKEYYSFGFYEKYKVMTSDSFVGFISEGILDLAEAAGVTPEYTRSSVLSNGKVRKHYEFTYKGMRFYGAVDAGNLEDLV